MKAESLHPTATTKRRIFARLSIAVGNIVQIAGILAACFALRMSRSAHSTALAVIAMVLAWVLLYFSSHEIAHWLLGRLVGIRFLFYTVGTMDWDEEFVDKAGLLGMAVYSMSDHWGSDYNYDPSFGLKVECETHTGAKEAHITTEELATLHNGPAPEVFYRVEQMFRDQYKPSAK